MKNSKLGLKALGLAILGALSLTAFFAAGVQAQLSAGEFQIDLAPALLATFHAKQEGVRTALVPSRNLTIDCNGWLTTSAEISSSSDALVTVLSSECTTWNLSLTVKLPCTLLTPGESAGNIRLEALIKPILHGGQYYLLFEPPVGQLSMGEVEIHGITCPLPLINVIKGSTVAEMAVNDAVQTLIEFSKAIQELSGDNFSFGGLPMFIDAAAVMELTGDHAGSLLGVV